MTKFMILMTWSFYLQSFRKSIVFKFFVSFFCFIDLIIYGDYQVFICTSFTCKIFQK